MVIMLGGGGGNDTSIEDIGGRVVRGLTGYGQIKHQKDREKKQDDERDRRAGQIDTQLQQESDWQKYRREQDSLRQAEQRQENASKWRAITGEDPPDSIYGPPSPDYDERSDIPAGLQRELRKHVNNPSSTLDEGQQVVRHAKLLAISRQAGKIRRLLERTAMPDPEMQGPKTAEMNREQMIPAKQAQKWIKDLGDEEANPTGTVDLDKLEGLVNDHIKEESYRRSDYEQVDEATTRIDNVFARLQQRSLEDGAGFGASYGPDPEAIAEAKAMRDQIAAHGITGRALQAMEQKVYDLVFGRTSKGKSGTASGSSKGDKTPHDLALDVWKGLPEKERTTDAFMALRNQFQNESAMNRVNPANDVGGIEALGGQPPLQNGSVGTNGTQPATGEGTVLAPGAPAQAQAPSAQPEQAGDFQWPTDPDPRARATKVKDQLKALAENGQPMDTTEALAWLTAAAEGKPMPTKKAKETVAATSTADEIAQLEALRAKGVDQVALKRINQRLEELRRKPDAEPNKKRIPVGPRDEAEQLLDYPKKLRKKKSDSQ